MLKKLLARLPRLPKPPSPSATPVLAGLGPQWTPRPFDRFSLEGLSTWILQVNRNARWPKQANHGSRPNSSVMRRMQAHKIWRKWKENVEMDQDDNIKHVHDITDEDVEPKAEEQKPKVEEKKEDDSKKKEEEE